MTRKNSLSVSATVAACPPGYQTTRKCASELPPASARWRSVRTHRQTPSIAGDTSEARPLSVSTETQV